MVARMASFDDAASLSITTLSIMSLSITTLSITTLSIKAKEQLRMMAEHKKHT
jgi:hypothetical protein